MVRVYCVSVPSMTKGLPLYNIAGTAACQILIIRRRKERGGLAS
jgi:hypothetical protein